MAAITIGTGLIWSTRVAAGADAYGYVSQADLWLQGHLHIDQGFGASVPWPLARLADAIAECRDAKTLIGLMWLTRHLNI